MNSVREAHLNATRFSRETKEDFFYQKNPTRINMAERVRIKN